MRLLDEGLGGQFGVLGAGSGWQWEGIYGVGGLCIFWFRIHVLLDYLCIISLFVLLSCL